jgi:aryl-alcohol dehydrogenase-like predicted oxidoreductase
MSFGDGADEKESAALFARCRDAGINLFDTADVYAGGRSEEVLGRLMEGERDALVVASKAHFPTGPDPNAQGLSRRRLFLAVEASLRRLRTDRLDLYFAHGFDPRTPIEETLRALDDLVRQGKVLYPALSNWAAWQSALALGLAARAGLARPACLQPMYNLIKRQAEVEILPLAASEGLGVLTYSPLAGGLLTGKYAAPSGGAPRRLDDNQLYRVRYGDPAHHETAARFAAHARERGVDPATLAVAWAASHPAVTAPILGARSVAQLEPALAALEVPMTPEWRTQIAALAPEPPPATDRSEERQGIVYRGASPRG